MKVFLFALFICLMSTLKGCKEKANVEEIKNPFNPILKYEIEDILKLGFNLEFKEDLVKLTYSNDSLLIDFFVEPNSNLNTIEDLQKNGGEIYGGGYYLRLASLDSISLTRKIKSLDAEIISPICRGSNRDSFFAQHKYNNLIFHCFIENESNLLQVPHLYPILDKASIENRKSKISDPPE